MTRTQLSPESPAAAPRAPACAAVAAAVLAALAPAAGATQPTAPAKPPPVEAAQASQRMPAKGVPPPPEAAEASPPERLSPDGIEVAGWEAGSTREESSPAAWGGERPAAAPGSGAPLSQRVASYSLSAVLDPVHHTIEGKEKLRWLNRSARPVRSLYFHLYLNAFEGAGSTFNVERARYGRFRSGVETKKGEFGYIELKSVRQGGRSATWTFVHPDGGPASDRTVVRVDLPEAVAPGATALIDIEFHDRLPRVVARTGYFRQYHLVAQWFPKVGVLELPGERGATAPRWNCHEFHLHSEFYADFGNYEALITAPAGYLVRATGEEQGEPERTPHGLAHRFVQDDVHDFVFTAWDGFAAPLVGVYEGPGSPRVKVEVLAAAEHRAAAEIALKATLDSLAYFSRTLGPYPYRHVVCVVPPFNARESGGMEYETFFTTIGTRDERLLSSFVRYVTVHEFGHGYFMGLLASDEFEEPFLDEGVNDFWDARMLAGEAIEARLPAPVEAAGLRLPSLAWWDYMHLSGTHRFQADPIAGNSWQRYSSGSYGLIYARTALVFHDLESLVGREALERGMKLYYRRWHHRHPGTADLRAALAEGTGRPEIVDRWFAEQVYANAPIDDRLTALESDEVLPRPGFVLREGKRVELDAEAVRKEIDAARAAWKKEHPGEGGVGAGGPFPFSTAVTARRFAAQVPQTLVVKFEGGGEERIDWPPGERWHRWVLVRPVRAISAQLDPQRAYLLDLNKLDDGRLRERAPLASRRWTAEVASFVSLLLSLLVTL